MTDGKDPRNRHRDETPEEESLNLSDGEVEISLICLRYFRGDWDMYLDYLQGARVTPEQRRRDMPLVEQLRDRDRRTEYLTAFVEDEVAAMGQRMGFEQLLKIWEHCLELDPESEPFPEFRGEAEPLDGAEPGNDAPSTLH